MSARVFSFVYTFRMVKCITGNKTKVPRFIFAFCFIVLLFYLSFQCNDYGNFVKDFTGTTKPRVLKFDTNIGYDKKIYQLI